VEIIYLHGNIAEDRECIFEKIKNNNSIFVLDYSTELYNYIDNLKLSDKILFKLKICKEINNIDIDYYIGNNKIHFTKFSELLTALNTTYVSYVIVKGDLENNENKQAIVKIQLSDIVQQLIYLEIPLESVRVMTEREYKNINLVKNFEASISESESNVNNSIKVLESQYFDKYRDMKDNALELLFNIKEELKNAESNKLKIAVTSSKKNGKSVIVNSMIGDEIAPTNLEFTAENNCVYKSSKEGYTFSYLKDTKKFKNTKELNEYIQSVFENMRTNNKVDTSNIYIDYKLRKKRASNYIIYDTPGIDLTWDLEYNEPVKNAVNEADVIILLMNYSKIDTELLYLKNMKEIYRNKRNYCSVIINLNKLDMRYDSRENKNTIRVLDYIRTKLIKSIPEFRDSIIIGTSALTYFNCIKAVKIKDCERLGYTNNFRNDLEECMSKYIGQNEMNILNFLSKITNNIKNFQGIKIKSIEELKQLSGIPNLLNYIEHIEKYRTKAKRVNSLINYVESEYKSVTNLNLSQIQKYDEELVSNQKTSDYVKSIIKRFSESINNIYDINYSDINQMAVNNNCLSFILKNTGTYIPFNFKNIADWFITEYIDKVLDNNKIIDYVSSKIIREKFSEKITQLFDASKKYREINEIREKIIVLNDFNNCFYNIVNDISNILSDYINSQFNFLWKKLFTEKEAIQEDLKDIINQRIGKLYFEIENYRNELKGDWNVPFLSKEPCFDFEFESKPEEVRQFNIIIDNEKLFNRIISEVKKEHKKNSTIIFRKFFQIFGVNADNKESVSFSKIFYDKEYILENFYDKNIKYEIKSYIDRANIEDAYINDKNYMKQELMNFIEHIETEMDNQYKFVSSLANKVIQKIDNTSEIESHIELLKKKKKCLNIILDCINSFYSKWKEKIGSEL